MTAAGTIAELPAPARTFLEQQTVLTLATASPAGVPHAADLLYVTDGESLLFWIRPDTVTARHVADNPRVAFTVRGDAGDLSAARGVQGAGEARVLLDGGSIDRAIERFAGKFPAMATGDRQNLSFFRIAPTQLHFIDNASAGHPSAKLGMSFHREVVFSVLRELPVEEVTAVAGELDTQVAAPGEVIVRQGAPADRFFIIVDGEVEVTREEDGETRRLATLKRGQFFGEVAILANSPRTATVTALTETTLLTLDHDRFRKIIAQSLATTEDFDEVVRSRLRAHR